MYYLIKEIKFDSIYEVIILIGSMLIILSTLIYKNVIEEKNKLLNLV